MLDILVNNLNLLDCHVCYSTIDAWYFLGNILMIAKIVVPLLIIIMGMIDFSKVVISFDDDAIKKTTSFFAKRIIASVVIIFLPTIIYYAFKLIDNFDNLQSDFAVCNECFFSSLSDQCATYRDQKEYLCKLNSSEESDIHQNNDDDDEQNLLPAASREYTAYLGDSRTNGLKLYSIPQNGKNMIYADDGGNLQNSFYTQVAALKTSLIANPARSYNIVLNYGVNDLYSDYVSAYRNFINSIDNKHKIIIVSVNPVNESGTTSVKNNDIIVFNNKLKSAFSSGYSNVVYCDVYNQETLSKWIDSYIQPLTGVDKMGVHYNQAGSNFIYNKIKNCIG